MSLPILWTDEAKETFDNTVIQIEYKWGISSAAKFVSQANRTLNTIALQPYLFKASYTSNVRQAFITKQTSMFYEVHSTYIAVLFFWDNRQEPIL